MNENSPLSTSGLMALSALGPCSCSISSKIGCSQDLRLLLPHVGMCKSFASSILIFEANVRSIDVISGPQKGAW